MALLYDVVESMMEEPYKRYSARFVHDLLEDILRSFLYWEGFITESELNTLNAYNNLLCDMYEYQRRNNDETH